MNLSARFSSLALAAVILLPLTVFAQEAGFFSNTVVSNPPPTGFTVAPVLDDNDASAAQATSVLGAAVAPLAVQVRMELLGQSALQVLNQNALGYILTEFNRTGADVRTKAVADAALRSAQSAGAFVGNFNLYPNLETDETRPAIQDGSILPSYAAARGQVGGGPGKQFAAPALFPGSLDFRSPAQHNSEAPNLRSAFFILPIERLALAELGLRGLTAPPTGAAAHAVAGVLNDPNQRLIPWITRFNNFENTALGGDAGFVQNAADPTTGQLLSRGDFKMMVLHYRLRGADDLILFRSPAGSVAGYSEDQERADMQAGWALSGFASDIISRGNFAFANLGNVVGDAGADSGDTAPVDTEISGAIWSGVYDRPGPATRIMAILISNLSDTSKQIDLPNDIGGFSVYHPPGTGETDPDNFLVGPGRHRLFNFVLMTSPRNIMEWTLKFEVIPLTLDANRNGTGLGAAFPAQEIEVITDTEVCPESAGNAALVNDLGPGATYHWYVQGGTVETGQDTRMITYSVGSSAPALIAVTASAGGVQYQGAAVRRDPPNGIDTPAYAIALTNNNIATGPDGPGLTYKWSIMGAGGILGPTTMRTVQFAVGATGTTTLTLVTTDAKGCARQATTVVTIDRLPVAGDDHALTSTGRPVDIEILANDSDPDTGEAFTVTMVGQPSFGTATLINNGTAIRYTPAGAVHADSFTYTITDSHGGSTVGTVTINDLYTSSVGDFQGLAEPASGTASENARHGFVRVTVARAGKFTGYLTLAGLKRSFSGTFDAGGVAHFTVGGASFKFTRRTGETPLALSLQLAPESDADQVTGLLSDGGAAFATVEASRTVTVFPKSSYTFAFLKRSAPNRGVAADHYPQGNGWATGSVSKAGLVSLNGRLAEYAAVVRSGQLTKNNRLPLYVSLYSNHGSLSGWVNFRPNGVTSDADGLDLDWFRPAQPTAGSYKEGWPGGIGTDLVGAKFAPVSHVNLLNTPTKSDADGNVEMHLTNGGLADGGLDEAFNLSPTNVLTKAGANPQRFRSLSVAANGHFSAIFRAPGAKTDSIVSGVILQTISSGTGFFLNAGVAGLVGLNPQEHPDQSP